ncbi:MAG TPA: molybdate ABC transporter substrate-binding protein [Stellaceae bacterium]|nr:molybdate ABC transporter substrate-binding protein [Stellaceae bacterium]
MRMPKRGFVHLVGSLVAALALVTTGRAADQGELTVMTSVALTPALDELKPVFERQDHVKLAITYDLISNLRKRVLAGEGADVIILSRPAMEDLQKEGKLAPGTLFEVASTSIAVAARTGTPKPDISTVDAFKKSMLVAKSIVYADPAKGGASGVYFAKVAERLGIADQLKSKTILVPGAQAAEVVAKGEAELGIAQASEIVPVSGAELVGLFPNELANTITFVGGIGSETKSAHEAKALFDFLGTRDAKAALKAKGFEPG